MKALVVVDMQNDFISGSLGSKEARAIVPAVVEKIKSWPGDIFTTQDTHDKNYLDTQEGKNLPVTHCVENEWGWKIQADVAKELQRKPFVNNMTKVAFGSRSLAEAMAIIGNKEHIEEIQLVGLCTDICVISNAMLLKAYLPEVPIVIDAACCAGVTPESHQTALNAMKACQIKIINE